MKEYKAMQLVKALKSGEYKQGEGKLVNDDDCFCVLGVACNISETDLEWERELWLGEPVWFIGNHCNQLPYEIGKEFGFYNSVGGRRDGGLISIRGGLYHNLLDANDCGVPFKDIADYIEKNYMVL